MKSNVALYTVEMQNVRNMKLYLLKKYQFFHE